MTNIYSRFFSVLVILVATIGIGSSNSLQAQIIYDGAGGGSGIGKGKNIVFLAGDHEYRSEEALPAMARILAKHHGFKCTVLFNIDKKTGFISPGNSNMPGTEALEDADLAVFFLRFQDLPKEQMQPIVDYLDRGGNVIGLRTSTHAFKIPKTSEFARFDHQYPGKEMTKGFGRQVLGETWAGHYGRNHQMSTRLDIVSDSKSHPILRGVEKPWANCGGYWTDPEPDSQVLAMTQPLESMEKNAAVAADKKPCPGAWVRNYKSKSSKEGRVFTCTSGASLDLLDDDFRRMMINACIWGTELESKITDALNVEFVGTYNPADYAHLKYRSKVKPTDLAGWDSPIMPETAINKPPSRKKNNKKTTAKNNKKKTAAAETAPVAKTKSASKSSTPFQDQDLNKLQLKKGDNICLVGNALGERLQHQNTWEMQLHQLYPNHNLTVRNLCFPGDEPQLRIRSKNFGDPDSHLTHSKASVILFFFGYNESFAGKKGLRKFKADLTKLIEDTKTKSYNDAGAPRMVLVSPIAFENTGDPNLPDGSQHNPNLELYTAAMKEVATATKIGFADVFAGTKKMFDSSKERLTLNGFHLNADGYKKFASIFNAALFGEGTEAPQANPEMLAMLDDKNFHWWHRYRAVNGFSIYGDRGKAGKDGTGTYNNNDVMERERAILDQMAANRDARIWAMAAGKKADGPIDDSNTLPFINPVTNVGSKNDPNKGKGKLGSLEYKTAAEQQKLFKLAPGYEITLVASEEEFPELANPVEINFDNKGRLWVAVMPSYPHWKPKTKMNDKLLIFEDDNNDGKADRCKVFADGLHQPTGFEIGNNGVYVAQQPDILFLQDTDGDDKEDTRVRKLVGFDSADSHHGIAGFYWGPGGNLYFEEGTFKFSQVESTTGLHRLAEAGVWRYNPRTEEFGVHVSLSFSNPWGYAFDRWGQDFIGDASGGNSYWATPISGQIKYPLKHPGGSHDRRLEGLLGDKPKNYKFRTLYKKRMRPLGGCEILSSSNFPEDVQGNWLVTNCITERTVMSHKIEEKGSGFEGTEVPAIVNCDDGNFRPVNIEMAPDGSLYIVDWHNALIGHLQHNLRDPSRDKSHGRIWRVTYTGNPLVTPPKIDGAPIADLLELLKAYENRTRYRAKRELAQRPTKDVLAAVQKWIPGLDKNDAEYERHLLEALWQYQTHNVVNVDLLKQLLNAKHHRARAAAVRVLSFWVDKVDKPLELLRPRIKDENPLVQLEAVRALSFMKGDDAIGLALEVLPEEGELDYYLQYTLDETMRALEQE